MLKSKIMAQVQDRYRLPFAHFIMLMSCACLLHAPHLFHQLGDVNYDFFLHYNWAREFADNFLAGDLYPRWVFHDRYGLGEPVFITYSPIYYYLVAFLTAAGFNNWVAMQMVAVLCNLAFAWFIYAAASHYVSRGVAFFIAVTVLLNPFLVMLHYKFHGLAWGAAAYFAHGMLFWALTRPEGRRVGLNGWAALAIALSVGTHIISALVNLICYSIYCLIRVLRTTGEVRQPLLPSIVSWVVTVAVGLLLSGVYLYPALYYLTVMNSEVWVGDYRLEAFAWPIFTMLNGNTQWFSIQWPVSVPALAMFALAGIYYFRFRGRLGSIGAPLLFALSASAVSVFFASELSYPIWTFPNPISQINLPYRFVSVTYTTAAFSVGLALFHAYSSNNRFWARLLSVSMGLSVFLAICALVKATYFDGQYLGDEIKGGEYTFGPAKKKFEETAYLETCSKIPSECVRSLRSAGGFSGVAEYQLKWAQPGYLEYAHKGYLAHCKDIGVQCSSPRRLASGMDFEITASAAATVVLPLFHYPAWQIQDKYNSFSSEPDPATGLIQVNIAAGSHHLEVRWRPTQIEKFGEIASWAGVGILLVNFMVFRIRRRH